MAGEILGNSVLVSIGGMEVGSQKNVDLKRSAKEIDTSTKTTGGWDTALAGNRKWSVDLDCLAVLSDAAQTALESAFENGDLVTVSVAVGALMTKSGLASIVTLDLSGPLGEATTYKVSFAGASALA